MTKKIKGEFDDTSRDDLIAEIYRVRKHNRRLFAQTKKAQQHARIMAGMVQVVKNVEDAKQEAKQ